MVSRSTDSGLISTHLFLGYILALKKPKMRGCISCQSHDFALAKPTLTVNIDSVNTRTFMSLRKPSIFFRALVLGAQGVFYNLFCKSCPTNGSLLRKLIAPQSFRTLFHLGFAIVSLGISRRRLFIPSKSVNAFTLVNLTHRQYALHCRSRGRPYP